jgi:hypothetical protein
MENKLNLLEQNNKCVNQRKAGRICSLNKHVQLLPHDQKTLSKLLLCVRAKNLVTKISCNLGGILSIKTGVF